MSRGEKGLYTPKVLAAKTLALKEILNETRQQSTWPVRAAIILWILATSLIPLAYFVTEELLRVFWLD